LVDGALMMTMLGDQALRDHYMQRAAAHPHTNADLMALLEARVAVVEGDPLRAIQQVEALEGTAYADPGQLWQRSLWLAAAELRAGNTARAAELVRQSLHATEQLGLDDLPERFEARLVRLLEPVWPRTEERATKSVAHLTMLGDFALRRGGADCTPTQGHGATLVKLLAVRGASPTEQLIDTLWPDADLVTGKARLRNLLSRIRTQCGEIIERRADALALSDEVNVDVDDFERGAAEVFAADSQRRAGLARLVLDAHSGELLPTDAYEDWAASARERIKRRQLSLVDIVVDDAFERGDLDDAVRSLDAAIAIEPLEESRYVRMCEALLVQGRRATAREVGERASTMLDELGLTPGPALRAVLQTV
jgi:DNA-binding SARP family transcriptional activator